MTASTVQQTPAKACSTAHGNARLEGSAPGRPGRGRLSWLGGCLLGWMCCCVQDSATANGIYRNGAGARAMALGGASVALPDQPLEALHSNPAGLGLLDAPALQLGLAGAVPRGEFSNPANANGRIDGSFGVMPEFALGVPLRVAPVTAGLAFVPDGALGADWRYVDAPGGLGGNTSYGPQKHHSEILVLRTALGAAVSLGEAWSVGASLGFIYNRNSLEAPYIFQSHPVLKGFKTLLDLDTDGFGFNGNVGLIYRPHEKVSIGIGYQTPTRLDSEGRASGNAGRQLLDLGGAFAGVQPDFRYDAEVANRFPQSVSAGLSWQAHPRVRSIFQVEWIDWSDAFDDLRITLTDGSNPDLNAFLGTDSLQDTVPLRWRDRVVGRAGLEFQATESLTVRSGYAYGQNPVPDATLLPLTAAISEHTITAGVGWQQGRYSIDLAYQYDLPSTSRAGVSGLQAGEYSNSRTRTEIHWFALTTGIRF